MTFFEPVEMWNSVGLLRILRRAELAGCYVHSRCGRQTTNVLPLYVTDVMWIIEEGFISDFTGKYVFYKRF